MFRFIKSLFKKEPLETAKLIIPKSEPIKKPEFNRHNIISDKDFLNDPPDFDIQKFLSKNKSGLVDYKVGERCAWQIILEASQYVSARVILVQLQKEMSLISTKEPTQRELKWAMGFGCSDNMEWISNYAGFENQVLKAAQRMRLLFDTTAEKYLNKDFNKVSHAYGKIRDGIVMSENKATAVLYIYTPFIGERDQIISGIKYQNPFGNYLFWLIWDKYFGDKNGKVSQG